jgi:hypothetical protein
MTREELEARAAELGIEGAGAIPTIKELRSLISAYVAEIAPADEDEAGDGAAPEAQNGLQSEDSGNPDRGGGGGEVSSRAPAAVQGLVAGTPDELAAIPEGCIVVYGLGPADRCAFFEQHDNHPGGEVFIQGGQFGIASRTPKLLRAIGRTLSIVEPS